MFGVRRVLPANIIFSLALPDGATPPDQFEAVAQLLSLPAPFHVNVDHELALPTDLYILDELAKSELNCV